MEVKLNAKTKLKMDMGGGTKDHCPPPLSPIVFYYNLEIFFE